MPNIIDTCAKWTEGLTLGVALQEEIKEKSTVQGHKNERISKESSRATKMD